MTNQITVECVDILSIRLKVSAELYIGEWKKILQILDARRMLEYYQPLNDLFIAVRQGIAEVEKREVISFKGDPPPAL